MVWNIYENYYISILRSLFLIPSLINRDFVYKIIYTKLFVVYTTVNVQFAMITQFSVCASDSSQEGAVIYDRNCW